MAVFRVALLLASLWCVFACRRAGPVQAAVPPAIELANTDRQIAATIERAKADVAREPGSVRAWGSLGAVLMTHKFHAEAITCFAEAEKLAPTEPRWPYLQGVILLAWAPDAALPKLARAAELTGDTRPTPKLKLADALLERGQLDEAAKHFAAVAKAHPDEPQALLGIGRVALAREQLEEALQPLKRAAASPPTARAAFALIAGIQHRLGNSAAAAEASRRVAALPREPAMADPFVGEISALQTGMQAWLTRADRLFRAGKAREAMALLERTVATYPDSATPWRILGQARLNEKNYPAAEKALRKALELAPNESVIHYTLGSVLAVQGRLREAADAFRKSAELWPAYAPAHFHLAQSLERSGKRAEAIEEYRIATQYDPAFAVAYRQLGAALALERRFEAAVQALQRACTLDPADRAAAALLEKTQTESR